MTTCGYPTRNSPHGDAVIQPCEKERGHELAEHRERRGQPPATRIVIVGESPSCAEHKAAFCAESYSGRRLRQLFGVEDFAGAGIATVNLFAQRPERWSPVKARGAAVTILHAFGFVTYVLTGRRVAEAFRVRWVGQPPCFRVVDLQQFVVIPHPSGRCRSWNEPEVAIRAEYLLRSLLT